MSRLYEDPILRKVMDLLNNFGPKELRGRWSIGDSLNIPKGILPHGFIAMDKTDYTYSANSEIRTQFNVIVTVAVDMSKEFSQPTDRSDSHEQVMALIEKRNGDFTIADNSVLGCLLKNRDLDKTQNLSLDIGDTGEIEVDYGIGAEKRGAGIVTAEGVLRFQITLDQVTPEYY